MATESTSSSATTKPTTYQFKIEDINAFKTAQNTKEIMSPFFELHGFKWGLRIFPNGSTKAKQGNVNYFLWLRSLPPKYSKIAVNITLTFKELDITASFPHQFTDKAVTRGWTTGTLKTADIAGLESLTFGVEITVHDIYSAAGNLLQYDDDDEKHAQSLPTLAKQSSELIIDKQSLQETRLDSIALKLEELLIKFDSIQSAMDSISETVDEADDNFNCAMNEINKIQKYLGTQYEQNEVVITKENNEIKEWLEKECNLGIYFETFVKNGVDNMAICRLLDMEHLEKMGIAKIGHRVQIAHKISVLKQKTES